MSSNDQSDDQSDEQRAQMEADELDERRSATDSQSRDRRVIARVSKHELRKNLRLSKRLCAIIFIASLVYIAALIGGHMRDSTLEFNRSIFFGVVVAILAVAFHHLGAGLKSYVENESKARLVIVSERVYHTLIIAVCTCIVLGISHLITLF